MWKEYEGEPIVTPVLPVDIDREILFLVLSGKCPFCKGKTIEAVDKEYPPKKVICGNCQARGSGMKMREAYVDLINNWRNENG